jgi:hypothetical protein
VTGDIEMECIFQRMEEFFMVNAMMCLYKEISKEIDIGRTI